MSGTSQLGALQQRARECAACALRPGCLQVVVAEGDLAAPLLIVGEAPGGEEDRQGRPLVGPAGQLLDRILAAAGLSRREALLTNAVQCRPPGDRPPTPLEVDTCTGLWLRPQLAWLRPRVVVTLGNVPTRALLGTRAGITQLRGQWRAYTYPLPGGQQEQTWLMPMFHPAYLLRQDSRAPGAPKSLTWRDIREVAAVLRGERSPDAAAPADSRPLL